MTRHEWWAYLRSALTQLDFLVKFSKVQFLFVGCATLRSLGFSIPSLAGLDLWGLPRGNLRPLADAKGRVTIQIRDLDQTVIGNPAHDIIRLGLSLASAARGSNLPGVILEQLVSGYEKALSDDIELGKDKSLWSNVVELISIHEAAYLDHCRRFALAEPA
jgi:hypothetical protein